MLALSAGKGFLLKEGAASRFLTRSPEPAEGPRIFILCEPLVAAHANMLAEETDRLLAIAARDGVEDAAMKIVNLFEQACGVMLASKREDPEQQIRRVEHL